MLLQGELGKTYDAPFTLTIKLDSDPTVEIRDKTEAYAMRVREFVDAVERERLWNIAVEASPPYQAYQNKTDRLITIFVAEPVE